MRRVSGDEVKDTRAYLIALQEDAEKASKRHSEAHPGDPFVVEVRRGSVEPKAQMSPEECAALAAMGAGFLGKMWRVQARPSKEGLQAWGDAASRASAYLPLVPPMYMAIGGLIVTTIVVFSTMFEERAAIRNGQTIQVQGTAEFKEPKP